MTYLVVPTNAQPLVKNGNTSQSWYRFFHGVFQGAPPASEEAIDVGGSPFAYTAPSGGFVIVRGGAVSSIQFTRAGTTLTGLTDGLFPLSQGDSLTVTYSGLPMMTWVPQ